MPVIADFFDRGEFPMDLIPRMAEMGLYGCHVEGYGCQHRSHLEYGLVCQELGRCDSGLRAMFSVQNSLVMFPIFKFGSETQRQKWLPGLASGDTIGCFGLLLWSLVKKIRARKGDEEEEAMLGRHIPFGPMLAGGALLFTLVIEVQVLSYFSNFEVLFR